MKEKVFNLNVLSGYNGDRIDIFLQSHLDKISRTKIQNLIREGFVKLNNNQITETAKKIKTNDTIEIKFPPTKETHIKPQKISLNIL